MNYVSLLYLSKIIIHYLHDVSHNANITKLIKSQWNNIRQEIRLEYPVHQKKSSLGLLSSFEFKSLRARLIIEVEVWELLYVRCQLSNTDRNPKCQPFVKYQHPKSRLSHDFPQILTRLIKFEVDQIKQVDPVWKVLIRLWASFSAELFKGHLGISASSICPCVSPFCHPFVALAIVTISQPLQPHSLQNDVFIIMTLFLTFCCSFITFLLPLEMLVSVLRKWTI